MSQINKEFADLVSAEKKREKIELFLSIKRKQIVEILYDKMCISMRELADAIHTSPTSLSNILLGFEKFEYKLIDSKREGKVRRYFLTDLGIDYIENCYKYNIKRKKFYFAFEYKLRDYIIMNNSAHNILERFNMENGIDCSPGYVLMLEEQKAFQEFMDCHSIYDPWKPIYAFFIWISVYVRELRGLLGRKKQGFIKVRWSGNYKVA